jgi:hypothetical protein
MAAFLPEMFAGFSQTSHPSNNPTEYNHNGVGPVTLVATQVFHQIAQDTGWTQYSLLQSVMEKAKYSICGVRSGTVLLKPG